MLTKAVREYGSPEACSAISADAVLECPTDTGQVLSFVPGDEISDARERAITWLREQSVWVSKAVGWQDEHARKFAVLTAVDGLHAAGVLNTEDYRHWCRPLLSSGVSTNQK